MSGRGRIIAGTLLVLAATGCVGRPGFIPTTRHLYDRFTPLAEPRPDVPVGALWIEGYGATGDAAGADNLETIRSLSGFTFDADFQANLTLGILKFLDLDPSLRKKVVARFNDLSVIRIKNWSKLAGPAGAPRIYEALKAGTISITTTGAGGLDVESHALSQNTAVVGHGTTGVTRTFVIDAKDMVFAVHVARYRPVQSMPVSVALSGKRPAKVVVGGYDLTLSRHGQAGADLSACLERIGYRLVRRDGSGAAVVGTVEINTKGGETDIDMPVPEAGQEGELFTQVRMSWRANASGCLPRSIEVQRTGRAVTRQSNPRAPGW